jgi:TolB-like protein/DNA-binding winged helix-turn-helix (wHTH) protein/Tfp pilus assembly protein PilF
VGESRPTIYRFGLFELDLEQRVLLRAGDAVPLTPKAFDTLAVLAVRPGKVVDKTELLRLVWPDTFVEENNLTQNISVLRKVLGEGDYIETIPRRGYRFSMEVEDVSAAVAMGPDPQPNPVTAPSHRSRSLWVWGASVMAATAILAFYASRRIPNDGNSNQVDSLVVLPFVNLSPDQENEYFSDGLTEELTNAVAHIGGLRVVARTSAFQFKGKAQDIRSIARQLHVSTVLEGSVRLQDKKLRVTVQLNDAQSGYHIWSQTYDRDEGDVLKVQEDISNQIARRIRPVRQPDRTSGGSRNLEAYNLYLLGKFHGRKPDQTSERRAVAFFQQAIEKDPQYAAAYAGLAECYVALARDNVLSPLEAWASARAAADKALALDENLAEAHANRAIVYLLLERNWDAAGRELQRAIALNENDATAHHWFSHYFVAMGRFSESLAESRRALESDPLDVQLNAHLSWHYLRARDYSNAIKAGLQTLELDPHSQLANVFLTWAYEDTGQWDRAIAASQLATMVHPEASILRAALQAGGPRGYWRACLTFLSEQKFPGNYQQAVYEARLGEKGKALDWLQLAFQRYEPDLIYVKSEPAFDWMAPDPRFKALTDAMKLP